MGVGRVDQHAREVELRQHRFDGARGYREDEHVSVGHPFDRHCLDVPVDTRDEVPHVRPLRVACAERDGMARLHPPPPECAPDAIRPDDADAYRIQEHGGVRRA